jgi:hypothetical protein
VKPTQRFGLSALLVLAAIVLPAFAFEYPLSSTSVRAAYMLGSRNDDITTEFLARYKHSLPMPKSGPHLAVISVETPYTQIVELGQTAINKDIQGAEKEFAGKDFPFIARVGVDLTDTYPGPPAWNPTAPGVPMPDFQRDFQIQLVQGKKEISVQSTQVYLLYSDAISNIYQISGAIIELRYDLDKIDSYDDVDVKVHTPDGQEVETTFALGHLR